MFPYFNPYRSFVSLKNKYYLPPAKTLKKSLFKVTLLVTLICMGSAVRAQYNTTNVNYDGSGGSGIGLTLGAGYDVPLHNLNGVYKIAPAFEGGITKQLGGFTFGLHAGYREFQPKQDSYALYAYGQEVGAISYSNYSIFSVYASAKYDFRLSRGASLYGGVNLGNYFTSYSYLSQVDNVGEEAGRFSGGFAYFAPKAGIIFAVGENAQLGLETKFNFYGSANYSYNTVDGGSGSSILYTTWTTGVVFNYRF